MSKRKILIVDDEAALVELLKDHFEFVGFEVLKAFDGGQAFERALAHKPEIILLDVIMPKVDGLEACRRLKENPETKAIPILMLTADAQQKRIAQVIAAGATAYMMKPFTIDAITSKVREMLPIPPVVPLQA